MASSESGEAGNALSLLKTFRKRPSPNHIAEAPTKKRNVVIQVPPVKKRETYHELPEDTTVHKVLKELDDDADDVKYRVQFETFHVDTVPFDRLLQLPQGAEALERFEDDPQSEPSKASALELEEDEESFEEVKKASRRGRPRKASRVETESSEDELAANEPRRLQRPNARRRGLRTSRRNSSQYAMALSEPSSDVASSDSGEKVSRKRKTRQARRPQRQRRANAQRSTRSAGARRSSRLEELEESSEEESEDSDLIMLTSDLKPNKGKPGRPKTNYTSVRQAQNQRSHQSDGVRQSERSTRHQKNMTERNIGDIYRSDSEKESHRPAPKAQGAREAFQPLSRGHPFHLRHTQQCDTCGNYGGGPQGQLIHCQGCTLSYHKTCLGNRATREHLVSKVGEADFVLQCRRCIGYARKKESTAPDQGICQSCRETGPSCAPFRSRKSAMQEEREREENDGDDPIVDLNETLINNVKNVLFRCTSCWRGFHFHHLISRSDALDVVADDETLGEERFREYSRDWICKECATAPAKVSGLVAWRPVDIDNYFPGTDGTDVNEDEKEYLVIWENKSYFQASWMPGAWTWGITAPVMRKAFAKREGNDKPKMTTEEAVPEDYYRIDIVLDVKFTSIVDTRAEEVDKARIREVKEALIKYKGLTYEEAVWERVPSPEDGDRWIDFAKAYDDWVAGRYIKLPKSYPLKVRVDKGRSTDFNKLEKKKQPENLKGGELMKYQLDGLNWLYYRWYLKKNAILADEMGLGKTMQVIAFLATLVEDYNCFPFLIVVPNSTCPNWRREIKQWAPSLRVVTYFGSSHARSMAHRYELFPDGSKTLRCHIVVTSYEAASDDSCKRLFRSVPWQGLIVDEGQRLKSDRNQLYASLSALKVPFSVLLTGTPLQNNARELFNLLQFLDDTFDAAALELEYADLNKDNIPQLHNMIRPFFLRRTKAEVLTFLPRMGQVVVPVSMTVVQRKLYSSILAKNPELVKAVFNSERALAKSERANLSNILMQLRKCLCHPFVYSRDIEERSNDPQSSHRSLVDASPKLKLLEHLLPKLHERDHRVLIFSQFLDMLDIVEDFLDGMGYRYNRLDGSVSSLQKQKRIDEFNAPESPLFAFLLSTRAGGIGINLATADTVIILDPDFNPHQDIQALSRAHRIGQKKKVLCFQLMTQSSAEEKIVQIGRKKMALDHVLIEQMDADEEDAEDFATILKHGAAEVLEGSNREIRYDDASVDKLLDRSALEDTKADEDQTAESQFSYARVWANDSNALVDHVQDTTAERAPDPSVWDRILQERERAAAQEAARRQQDLGRGKRARPTVDYSGNVETTETPVKNARRGRESDSDTDFMGEGSGGEESGDEDRDDDAVEAAGELDAEDRMRASQGILPSSQRPSRSTGSFRRSNVIWPAEESEVPDLGTPQQQNNPVKECVACHARHREGYCPLKLAGPEHCNLCGLAHYGVARTCPHVRSETQVREMLAALKQSHEPRHLVQEAMRYLSGVKGTLAQEKRRKAEKMARMQAAAAGTSEYLHVPQAYDLNQPGSSPSQDYSTESQKTRRNVPGTYVMGPDGYTSNYSPKTGPPPSRPQFMPPNGVAQGATQSSYPSPGRIHGTSEYPPKPT
ncbi:MAG: hypothetical protein M1831_004013 [Alyxoria varia]|nr:MAG: hypothetical protein M1831_004013 [Alyxoria varia]